MFGKFISEDLNIILTERCSYIIGSFRNNNFYYRNICEKEKSLRKELIEKLDTKHHYDFNNLIRINQDKALIEQLYLYLQGLKDYSELTCRLEDVVINNRIYQFEFDVDNIDEIL